MHAVIAEHARYALEAAMEPEAQPEIVIGQAAQFGIPAANALICRTAEEGTDPHRAIDQPEHVGVRVLVRGKLVDDTRLRVDQRGVRIRHHRSGMRFERLHRRGDRVLVQQVVRAQVAEDRAARHRPALVQRARLAHVRVAFPADTTIIAFDYIQRTVTGAIIKYNILKIRIILSKNTLHSLRQQICAVIRGCDDGYERSSVHDFLQTVRLIYSV